MRKLKSIKMALLALTGSAVLFAQPIFAAGMTNTIANEPFKVTTTLVTKSFHVDDFKAPLRIRCVVQNITDTNQSIKVWSCSWPEQWKSSDLRIESSVGIACTANTPITVNLMPGKSWENELKMFSPDYGKRQKQKETISFRLGFSPLVFGPKFLCDTNNHCTPYQGWDNGKKTYWSNELKVDLLPK